MIKSGILLGLLALAASAVATGDDFQTLEKTWRDKRHARLTSESGWLTLVGLHWLSPGENAMGSGPDAIVALPAGKAPAKAGVLVLDKQTVTIKPDPAAGITLDGQPVGERVLADDLSGKPDVLKLGDLSFFVIRRGDRIGVRVKDPNSPVRTGFKGIDYFPPSPKYRVEATFHPYDAPRTVQIPNVLGTTEPMTVTGYVSFTLDGKKLTLEPVIEDPDDPTLWFIFKDETSGKETYPAGRFLYSEMPKDGKVVVDFNQAYNPPCAFTPYATCPLPPKNNALPVRIEAGEKAFGHDHAASR